MQIKLMAKLLILMVLMGLFTIPLVMIGVIGRERQGYRDRVVREIGQSTAGSQRLMGPVLVVPYRERVTTRTIDAATGKVTETERLVEDKLVLLPESLVVQSEVHVESRRRGIYEGRVFESTHRLAGRFVVRPPAERLPGRTIVAWQPAALAMSVSDPRGLRRPPATAWNGRAVPVTPGTALADNADGFRASVGALAGDSLSATFAIDLRLIGTEELMLTPVGHDTRVEMRSSWPHPSFAGSFLPDHREVTDKGFTATWQLSRFATGLDERLERGTLERRGPSTVLGVRFIEPVDVYSLANRALKYGILFVMLTFVAFFLFEVLRRLAIHPVQYGLVGAALALFFLLLLSLAEHVPFAAAYTIAALACVGLLGYYVAHVLGGLRRGAVFAVGLALLYALLYVVLQSEDWALLLGTLLLFAVLAFVMVATRRVDWYRVGETGPAGSGGPPGAVVPAVPATSVGQAGAINPRTGGGR